MDSQFKLGHYPFLRCGTEAPPHSFEAAGRLRSFTFTAGTPA
jgi:hypothetical protein